MPASNVDKPILESGPHPLNERDEVTHPTNLKRGADGKLAPVGAYELPNIEKAEAKTEEVVAEEPSPQEEKEEESLAAGVKVEGEEEKPAAEKKRPSNDVQKRIDREVRFRREAERRALAAEQRAQEAERHLQGYRQRIDYSDMQAVTSREEHIKSATDAAQREYLAAAQDVDNAKMLEATRKLAALAADQKEIEIYRRQRPFPQQQQQFQPPVQPQQPQAQLQPQRAPQPGDDLALEWAEENKWFNKDRALTSVAYTIDSELKEEGVDPNTRAFWIQLNKRLREEMPHKFQAERRSPTQPVAGASRAPARSSQAGALSDSQKEMARRLGVSYEDYARFVPKG